MLNKVRLVFLFMVLTGCINNEDIAHGRPYGQGDCMVDCPDKDVDVIDIKNVDGTKVYLLYGSSPGGTIMSGMQSKVISANSTNKIPIPSHQLFTHLYFFADEARTKEIGKLIIKNIHPTYVTYCDVKVRNNGNFSSNDNHVFIRNTLNKAVIKYTFLDSWYSLPTNGWGDEWGFASCGTKILDMPPSTKFMHIHFHDGAYISSSNLLSEVIFQNTASNKINISKFIVK